jgi:hypothetical protein
MQKHFNALGAGRDTRRRRHQQRQTAASLTWNRSFIVLLQLGKLKLLFFVVL